MQLVAALALTLVLRAAPDAPPPSAARPSAEAELEAQLAATSQTLPPAEVLVVVDGPDPTRFRLEQATLRLDGAPVVAVTAAAASSAIAAGKPPAGTTVSDGDHVFTGQLVYRGQALGPHPWEEGPKWTLPARLSLQASRGLRLVIRLTVEVNERAPVPAQRLGLRTDLEPQMMVAVDDAPLPPPPLPTLPPAPTAPAAVAAPTDTSPPPRAAPTAANPVPPKKKKTAQKSARAARPAAVPATVSPETAESLEQATARLRAALSAPRDGGPPAAGEASH